MLNEDCVGCIFDIGRSNVCSISPFFLATTGAPRGSIGSANDPQIYINYSPDTQATQSNRLEDSQNPVTRVPMVCTEHAQPESQQSCCSFLPVTSLRVCALVPSAPTPLVKRRVLL
ncbi:hypothetical protein IG631_05614 [Alternaria alternata]|nr:hypothetical protein IG631_05614 [Alternaria alternata]